MYKFIDNTGNWFIDPAYPTIRNGEHENNYIEIFENLVHAPGFGGHDAGTPTKLPVTPHTPRKVLTTLSTDV
jgi:hypothetical protein